jgi:hypothetical protein
LQAADPPQRPDQPHVPYGVRDLRAPERLQVRQQVELDPKRWQKPVPVRQRLSVRMPAGLRRAIRGRRAVQARGSL